MKLIDFNDNFFGFEANEDILIDTGVLFAFYNGYDAYHTTVKHLFSNFIFKEETDNMFLYVNPTILNEITHLSKEPLRQYIKAFPTKEDDLSIEDANNLRDSIVSNVRELIENEILLVLPGDKESALKQLDLYKSLGAADAVNASIANLYGISFLTTDHVLARNINNVSPDLPNIGNVYYTTGRNRDYY